MKKIILIAFAAVAIAACNSEKRNGSASDSTAAVTDSVNAPVLKFEETNYEFGVIKQGEKVTHEFKFTNAGKSPLVISAAQASCGCTVPEYPKEPIAPGADGVIKVVFNSAGKSGKQTKSITITSNAVPATSVVYLNGEVQEPK
ncbi:DUF1573 domain-containing protein [Pedobacter sp. BS3]|uniref:DUF1573 domain-containing protein n=1 Tax=Pedobacter sp. BS3 TaxID=2567937 RepID=UPI0011EF7B36|nr:DUF1573 domain-containing protein [Pedobacter sp. BS3]TZF82558.1 DUF1573 domain-containing protein [Pedobacter sp. BS3]